MHKRYWFYIIAIGLALPFHAAGQDAPEPPVANKPAFQIAEPESDNTAGADDHPLDIAPMLRGIESSLNQLSTRESESQLRLREDRKARDLMAQEAMARWAKWMFFAAAASVLLTCAGLILLWHTMIHTREAARHTKVAAAAAEQTVERQERQHVKRNRRTFRPPSPAPINGISRVVK